MFLSKKDEEKSMHMDLETATKSLQRCTKVSEGLRVNDILQLQFPSFSFFLLSQTLLREVALEKQQLAEALHQCRQANARLFTELANEREQFQLCLNRMQFDINAIQKTLMHTKVVFLIRKN